MGLVSYLKDLYYNSRLNKASNLLSEGNASEAEQILISILDKHPMAVAKLAEHYYSLSKSRSTNVDKIVSLFNKIISLESKGGEIYDKKAYNSVLTKYVKDILCKAKDYYSYSSFDKCSVLLSSINKTKCKSEQSINLCCLSDINILLQKIDKTKCTDKDFAPIIEQLKSLWRCCKDTPKIKETILKFCDKQSNDKRHYVAAIVLGIILGNKYHQDCLQKIALVVLGNDWEINPKLLKDVVTNYGRQLVLQKGIAVNDTVTLFEKCWQQSYDYTFVIDILRGVSIELRNAIVARIIDNHKIYLSNSELFKSFTKWINESYNVNDSIKLYEKIHNLGYNVEDYYVSKVHILLESLSYDLKVLSLNKARALYPKSKIIISDTLNCAKWYESHGDNTLAIQIADSIISDCAEAIVVKAKALCNLGNQETNTDKRRKYVEQAFYTLDNSKTKNTENVRQYLQQSYLNVAEQYYSVGDINNCYSLLHSLAKQNYDKALISITIHRLSEINKCSNNIERLKKIDDTIDEINAYKVSYIANVPEYCSLWSEKINTTIEVYRTLDNYTAIAEFEKLITAISAVGFDNVYTTTKCTLLQNNIIERKYIIARDLEKSNKLNDAATAYKEINTLEKKRAPTLSALRFILCKLKLGDTSNVLQNKYKIYSLLRNAAKAFKAEKEDIAYRFSLTLLKAGEDKEALYVLSEYLPDEIQLKKACEQGAIIKAQAKLDDFNQKLDAIKNKTLPASDAVYFINHMLEYAEIIKPILDLPRATLSKYRAKIKNYAIFKLFDEGKFDVAFDKMIKEHSDYIEDLTALRNIALICLNAAEAKQLKKSNYQKVISIWLTAIYQEKLFVKSLDYTSWDNQYTFTLQNAYGHFDEYDYDNLPDNVNFNNPEENSIISIREVQRTLLDRFEANITDNQTYHEFFTAQKDAMDALIALNLDEKCTLVAPYIATKDKDIFDEISAAFNRELEGHYDNWEDVLSVGVLYGLNDSLYSNYSTAKDLVKSLKDAIVNKNNIQLFTLSNVAKIKKFDNMYSSFTSFVGSKVSALKSDNQTSFKSNFDFYNNVCASLKDSTISFTFSNYVMHYIVGEVNNGKMGNAEAAKFILSIFLLDISNARVKDNLATLFEMLSRDKSNDANTAVNTILSKVQTIDAAFYRKLQSEYDKVQIDKGLNDIVDRVNNHTLVESQALSKVFALYENNSSSERVCETLAQLCAMCIMKYIIRQEYGGSSVTELLDRIYNNMSSEFKKHRNEFTQSYNAIWDQLPVDAKLTILGNNPSATLNDSGKALKRGLEYYKKFGGVTESSSLSDILGSIGGLGGYKKIY